MTVQCKHYPCDIVKKMKKKGLHPTMFCPCDYYEEMDNEKKD